MTGISCRLLILAALLLPAAAPAAPAAPFASDRITVRSVGRGPDVVLVPGMTSSPSAWASTVAAIPGYRYHLVQVKGFAGTPAEGNAAGDVVAPVAGEIARYIAAAKLRRPALVGHSMGGTVALMIAARHPRSVSRIMVVDMLPFMGAIFMPPGQAPSAAAAAAIARAQRARMLAATREQREATLTAMTGAMVDDPAQRGIVIGEAIASDPTTVANTFAELIRTDLGPELPRIAVPATVLYVTPRGSPLNDAQIDAVYRSAFAPLKRAALVRVPRSAHFIMADNPAFFRAQLSTFLK